MLSSKYDQASLIQSGQDPYKNCILRVLVFWFFLLQSLLQNMPVHTTLDKHQLPILNF